MKNQFQFFQLTKDSFDSVSPTKLWFKFASEPRGWLVDCQINHFTTTGILKYALWRIADVQQIGIDGADQPNDSLD
jgi:hypothetical protein